METVPTPSSQLHRQVRKWLASRFSPTCSVFASQAVKDILRKQSSLTPAELFRPFSEVGSLGNVALQTCEKNQPFRLKNFKVDFVDSNKIDGHNSHDQSMLIDFIIQNSSPNKFAESNSINYVQAILSSNKDVEMVRYFFLHCNQ